MTITDAITRATAARDNLTQRIADATAALAILTADRDRLDAALSTTQAVPPDHWAVLDEFINLPATAETN